jgi:S-adenosylmethionine:tRNA ribosyltransferase-isomerase
MKLSDFDYDLPETLIASKPPKLRGTSRLLVLHKTTGMLSDQRYSDVAGYISPGDVIVLNDTKVIPARLFTKKKSNNAPRELILLEQHGHDTNWHNHNVLYRKRLSIGDILIASNGCELRVEELQGNGVALISSPVNLLDLAQSIGTVPLPPYMHRKATDVDRERYQTLWATHTGSVAAPTASLNMTKETIQAIQAGGGKVVYATLHVGMGTFLPIRADNIADHVMHQEYFEIPKATVAAIQAAKQQGHKVLAVGTTIVRTLEYAAEQILHEPPCDLHGEADIFIYPGFQFQVVDTLLTNFHAPHATVLMLAAAFAGWDNLRHAYEHAVDEHYAFLSYGDSMLIVDGGHS